MPETGARKLAEIADIRHRVRRLQWFRNSFRDAADDIGRKFHFAYAVDDRTLVDAFFRWARRFEEERVDSARNRMDFAVFAGGLMLRELCLLNPAHKTGEGQFVNLIPPEPLAKICEFWPEGYLYTTYCRNLVQAILEQEFNVHPSRNPALSDLRVWQSFRENFRDNPSLASAFFDVFVGVEPNWSFPEHFLSRPGAGAVVLKLTEA
jgi:hypothetical protein